MFIIIFALEIYKWIILIRILITWLPALGIQIDPHNPFLQFLHQVTEPVLAPLRSFTTFGTLDFSPLLVWIAISFLQGLLAG